MWGSKNRIPAIMCTTCTEHKEAMAREYPRLLNRLFDIMGHNTIRGNSQLDSGKTPGICNGQSNEGVFGRWQNNSWTFQRLKQK